MFRRFLRLRVLRPVLALALVAGFLATPMGIAHVGRLDHDPCDSVGALGDPDGPRLESSGGRGAHGHCFACHWFRSLRSALVAALVVIPDACAAVQFAPDAMCPAEAGGSLSAGARAPPA